MKRSILIGLFALVTGMLYAQGDVNPTAPRMEHTQSFDGFLLDLDALYPTEPVKPMTQSLQALMPDYSQLLLPTPSVTFGTLSGSLFSPSYSLGTFTTTHFNAMPTIGNVQVANFRLRNGMTISTMGDYDANGHRVNRPVLPWQRNNFQGAFQIKSGDGKFSFGIHVSNGAGPY